MSSSDFFKIFIFISEELNDFCFFLQIAQIFQFSHTFSRIKALDSSLKSNRDASLPSRLFLSPIRIDPGFRAECVLQWRTNRSPSNSQLYIHQWRGDFDGIFSMIIQIIFTIFSSHYVQ